MKDRARFERSVGPEINAVADFFFYIYCYPCGHTKVSYIVYYLDYSSFVLALIAQLLSTLTWLLDGFRSGDPRSSARSPHLRLGVGIGFRGQYQVSASSVLSGVLNSGSVITVKLF